MYRGKIVVCTWKRKTNIWKASSHTRYMASSRCIYRLAHCCHLNVITACNLRHHLSKFDTLKMHHACVASSWREADWLIALLPWILPLEDRLIYSASAEDRQK